MVFPYDNRPGGRNARYVPLDVARKLERQRDELIVEVQRLRREADRLRAANESAKSENEQLVNRVRQAEREARELREALAQRDADQRDAAEEEARAAEERESAKDKSAAGAKQAQLVETLSARIDELTGDLERVRERTERTVDNARREERVRLLSGLGAVLDSIERGLDMEASGPWRQGLEGIRAQLVAFLRAEGATLIGEVGERMNPSLHEAVEMVASTDVDTGHIVRVNRHGLQLEDGTLVRPAQVAVAR